jgi:hypothetical protein
MQPALAKWKGGSLAWAPRDKTAGEQLQLLVRRNFLGHCSRPDAGNPNLLKGSPNQASLLDNRQPTGCTSLPTRWRNAMTLDQQQSEAGTRVSHAGGRPVAAWAVYALNIHCIDSPCKAYSLHGLPMHIILPAYVHLLRAKYTTCRQHASSVPFHRKTPWRPAAGSSRRRGPRLGDQGLRVRGVR